MATHKKPLPMRAEALRPIAETKQPTVRTMEVHDAISGLSNTIEQLSVALHTLSDRLSPVMRGALLDKAGTEVAKGYSSPMAQTIAYNDVRLSALHDMASEMLDRLEV